MVGPPTCPETYSRQRSARADKQSQHSNGQFSLRERPGLKGNSQASKLGAPLSSATAAIPSSSPPSSSFSSAIATNNPENHKSEQKLQYLASARKHDWGLKQPSNQELKIRGNANNFEHDFPALGEGPPTQQHPGTDSSQKHDEKKVENVYLVERFPTTV